MKSKLRCLSIAALALVLIGACPIIDNTGDLDDLGASDPIRYSLDPWGETGTKGGNLRVGGSIPDHFRFWNAESSTVSDVTSLMHTSLLRRNQATLEWEPALAESYSVDADSKGITITLREGLFWSDGDDLTIEDLIYSAVDLFLSGIIDTSVNLTIDGAQSTWSVVDPQTLRISSSVAYASWEEFASIPIMPKHIIEPIINAGGASAVNEMWTSQTPPGELVSSGPFMVKEIGAGPDQDRLILEANPYYFESDAADTELPYLDTITMIPGNFVDLFNAQTTDLVEVFGQGIDDVSARPDSTLYESGVRASADFIAMNQNPDGSSDPGIDGISDPELSWLTNREFRRALAHLVDRSTIISDALNGRAVPRYSIIHPSSPFYWTEAPANAPLYDVAAAQSILDTLGWIDSDSDGIREDDSGNPISLTIATNAGNVAREAIAEIFSQSAALAGIDVQTSFIPFGDLVDQLLGTYDWELVLIGFTSSIDPLASADTIPSSGNLHLTNPGQSSPATQWEADVDNAFIAAATTVDENERRAQYRIIQEIWLDKAPWVYTAAPETAVAASNAVGNLDSSTLHPFTEHGFRGVVSRLYLK